MALASWIAGLMAENCESVGFIPEPSVDSQYIANGRYVLQLDEAGRRVGYLLHGAPMYGRSLNIAQHCIQGDQRQHGYGEAALNEVIRRAEVAGARAITARCATTLDSLGFWQAMGFHLVDVVPVGKRRGRTIARLYLPLALPLLPCWEG
jgi:L-amino acid N-acyltransferase YncA